MPVSTPHNTNFVIASYATAHTRLELYKYLDNVGWVVRYIVIQILLSTHKKPEEIEALLTEYMGYD
jgi:dsRNA-specific ribonuclease